MARVNVDTVCLNLHEVLILIIFFILSHRLYIDPITAFFPQETQKWMARHTFN